MYTHTQPDTHMYTHTHTHTHTQPFKLRCVLYFHPCVSPHMCASCSVTEGDNLCSAVWCRFWWVGSAGSCATCLDLCQPLHLSYTDAVPSRTCLMHPFHPCVMHQSLRVACYASTCAAYTVVLTRPTSFAIYNGVCTLPQVVQHCVYARNNTRFAYCPFFSPASSHPFLTHAEEPLAACCAMKCAA